ncbi:Os03g0788250 [Oryza sativa Japonica Group]|uniref:Os03g0788250 protein n=1 Tax=Oryza sativa subsp. japonica TaxID=39947 RepID=A0A0P0W409_ORYSJ|nr:Os03g0788250 [Oryza sativa Japonica Group]
MEPSPYGGVGGKIRRRPASRAAATPYERPPAAAAAEAEDAYPPQGGGGGGGWVSRLVDPASRLIAGGAARLFSTVFRKRLDPAPAPAPPKSTPPGEPVVPVRSHLGRLVLAPAVRAR